MTFRIVTNITRLHAINGTQYRIVAATYAVTVKTCEVLYSSLGHDLHEVP